MVKNLTIQEKLLLAALELESAGKDRFSAEDLVVIAWRKFPETFGLLGYADEHGIPLYPNSNRIYAEIMGSKPLRRNGYLKKVGSKMYQLTELGRAHAKAVANNNITNNKTKWALAREYIEFIRRLFDTKAARKYREHRGEDISFFDACGFWGINPASNAKEIWAKFAEIESVLDITQKSFKEKESVQFRHGGDDFSLSDLKTLIQLHSFLQAKFGTEIEHIKKRTDERRT
jgi:hypothetical protein